MERKVHLSGLIYDYIVGEIWEMFSKAVNYSFAIILGFITFSFLFNIEDFVGIGVFLEKVILGGQWLLMIFFAVLLFIGSFELTNNFSYPDKYYSKLYSNNVKKLLPFLIFWAGTYLLYYFAYIAIPLSEIVASYIVIILWLDLKNRANKGGG